MCTCEPLLQAIICFLTIRDDHFLFLNLCLKVNERQIRIVHSKHGAYRMSPLITNTYTARPY